MLESKALRDVMVMSQWTGAVVLLVPPLAVRLLRCPERIAMVLFWLLFAVLRATRWGDRPEWLGEASGWTMMVLVVLPPVYYAWRHRRAGRPHIWVTFWLLLALAAGVGLALRLLPGFGSAGDPPDAMLWLLLLGVCMLPVVVGAAPAPMLSSPAFLATLCYWGMLLLRMAFGNGPAASRDPMALRILLVLGLIVPLSLLPRWWRSAAAPTPRQA